MADTELGLAIAFYLYPLGLFLTLFSSQLIRYRYRDAEDSPAATNEKKVRKAHRLYTNLIWVFQLLLSPLLVCPPYPHHPIRDAHHDPDS
jgi:ATP-binding cassette, subfamily B, vacuolar membrane transporter HMT1/ACLQ